MIAEQSSIYAVLNDHESFVDVGYINQNSRWLPYVRISLPSHHWLQLWCFRTVFTFDICLNLYPQWQKMEKNDTSAKFSKTIRMLKTCYRSSCFHNNKPNVFSSHYTADNKIIHPAFNIKPPQPCVRHKPVPFTDTLHSYKTRQKGKASASQRELYPFLLFSKVIFLEITTPAALFTALNWPVELL